MGVIGGLLIGIGGAFLVTLPGATNEAMTFDQAIHLGVAFVFAIVGAACLTRDV